MRVAFKEWAVVVDALARGEQIVILRKGGISEGRGGFEVEHDRFLLFPTLFHQQRELVSPAAQARYDLLAPSLSPTIVHIEAFAEVVDWRKLESLDDAMRLRGQHIWKDEVIRERFERGRNGNLYAMAVRVYRLTHPVDMPVRPEYGGCKSWIELDPPVTVHPCEPVLCDDEFAAKLAEFEAALGRPTAATT